MLLANLLQYLYKELKIAEIAYAIADNVMVEPVELSDHVTAPAQPLAVKVNVLGKQTTAWLGTLITGTGGLGLIIIEVVAVAVHPFAGFVTVKVYVPAAFTVGVAVFAPETMFPPLLATQANVAPGVVEEPLNAIDVTVHVSSLSAPAFAFGGVLFSVTVTVSSAKQPTGPAFALTV